MMPITSEGFNQPNYYEPSVSPLKNEIGTMKAEFGKVFTLRFDQRNTPDDAEKTAQEFKKLLDSRPWFKAHRVEGTNSFEIDYHPKEIEAILRYDNDLHPFFARGSKSVFQGYVSTKGGDMVMELDSPTQSISDENRIKTIPTSNVKISHIKSSNEKKLLASLLKDAKGICIGDTFHHDRAPKEFLIEHLKYLKSLGVNTLFLEHLYYDTQQKTLDEYHASESTEMPKDLKYYLMNLYSGSGFDDLVVAAKHANIRVVAIESKQSYEAGAETSVNLVYSNDYKKRGPSMNLRAYDLVQKEAGDGKYIVFCGGTHVLTHEGIPGVSQLLGIPNIFIEKNKGFSSHFASALIEVNMKKHPRHNIVGYVNADILRSV